MKKSYKKMGIDVKRCGICGKLPKLKVTYHNDYYGGGPAYYAICACRPLFRRRTHGHAIAVEDCELIACRNALLRWNRLVDDYFEAKESIDKIHKGE